MEAEITLVDGTVVRVRPTPPLAASAVVSNDPGLATPPVPMVQHATKLGDKTLPLKQGEPGWDEYVQEVDRVKTERREAQVDFTWDYGIVAWKPAGTDEWVEDVGEDWEFPTRLAKYGIKPSRYGKRVDYIKYVLLQYGDDLTRVQELVYGLSAPLTDEEVDAARDLF